MDLTELTDLPRGLNPCPLGLRITDGGNKAHFMFRSCPRYSNKITTFDAGTATWSTSCSLPFDYGEGSMTRVRFARQLSDTKLLFVTDEAKNMFSVMMSRLLLGDSDDDDFDKPPIINRKELAAQREIPGMELGDYAFKTGNFRLHVVEYEDSSLQKISSYEKIEMALDENTGPELLQIFPVKEMPMGFVILRHTYEGHASRIRGYLLRERTRGVQKIKEFSICRYIGSKLVCNW
ncbi:hypothetical protein PFISCL1PPCAC_29162 [Pristionchus fissidentatus]|uniref:Uncharacterized protein n=1 Tax=Pristionchus fissidentatus TaxID=1538716 RepID=A0AAV5WEK1_9BILA|nr:hypothetical protein PFISCL1PPCAC_20080 [Pristionchus fissidentatus]GMT37865.1 hypothetical protein PFISCL1PPCAC_29162 [Pristionchus fissidentatus]